MRSGRNSGRRDAALGALRAGSECLGEKTQQPLVEQQHQATQEGEPEERPERAVGRRGCDPIEESDQNAE